MLARPRVLLADDHVELLSTLRRLLTPACDVVGCLTDGEAVVEAAPRLQPDVIVLDLFMPPTDGLEICRRVKQIAPRVQVILISASTDADIGEEALRAGAFRFISKMSAADALLPAIQRAVTPRPGRPES